jgi:cytochrome P450 family 110
MLPPGPSGPAIWNTIEFMLRPQQMVARHRSRYGDVFRLRTLMLDAVFVCTPVLAKEVFAHDPEDYGNYRRLLGDTLGARSLSSTCGAQHRGQRKLLNPRFHGAQVRRFLEAMKAITIRHLAPWHEAARRHTVIRMIDVGKAISLDVIAETVFGAHAGDRERARSVLKGILEGFSPLIVFTPHMRNRAFPPWRTFLARRAAFDGFVRDVLATRRQRTESGEDVVTMLLDVRDEHGAPMADDEIRDHLLLLLLAGYETTSIALAWGVYWLLRERRVLTRLREELDALGPEPSVEALARAEYLGAVCDETLRIRPIFTDSVRPLTSAVQIGGWTVPAGSAVVVALQSILSDPAVYPEPDHFRPERFLERKYSPAEFGPFGGGHRRCLGAAFAEHQLRVVLGTIATSWDLELADKRPEWSVRHHVNMTPARGVRLRVLGPRARS